MDTSDPDITFDEDGVCHYCHTYDQRFQNEVFPGEEGQRRLKVILDSIKEEGRGKPYDCIIGVSGGVDSTTLAWHAAQHGMRPLALHLDNGWDSELAVQNITNTLDKLNIPLHTHVIDWEEFRDVQFAFLRASVPNIEIPSDHAINALLYGTAAKMGIRHILLGTNIATEAIMPLSFGHYNLDLKHLRAIHKRFGRRKKVPTFPTISLPRFVYNIMVKGVRVTSVLNFVDYQKKSAVELLKSELDWRDYGGKHFESIITRFFQGYILPTKFGFDKRRPHLSCQINSGDYTRDEALAEMEKDAYPDAQMLAEDRAFFLKKFELTEPEFEAIMAEPPRLHTDYPCNEFAFIKARRLKALLKRIAKRR